MHQLGKALPTGATSTKKTTHFLFSTITKRHSVSSKHYAWYPYDIFLLITHVRRVSLLTHWFGRFWIAFSGCRNRKDQEQRFSLTSFANDWSTSIRSASQTGRLIRCWHAWHSSSVVRSPQSAGSGWSLSSTSPPATAFLTAVSGVPYPYRRIPH